MILKDIITYLQETSLKDRYVEEVELIKMTNRALLRIYRDFNLSNARQDITLTSATTYDLDDNIMIPVHATTLRKYLKDDDGNLLVTGVSGEEEESDWVPIPINDYSDTNSILWESYDSITFRFPTIGQVLRVYTRKHATFLTGASFDAEVPLPLQFLQSLEYYVGHLAHLGREPEKAREFLALYGADRKEIRDQGLENKNIDANLKLDDRDFP